MIENQAIRINSNGIVLPVGEAQFPSSNRSFRYGDGLFESIRVFEGRVPFFERHWLRLQAGMKTLRFAPPDHFTSDYFQQQILQLIENQGNWRIRLTVWRSGGGLYFPENNAPEFLIEATPLPSGQFELNEKGLRLGIFQDVRLGYSTISSLKTCNALPFVLAAMFRQENGLDDCLLLNRSGRIACGGSSNVFCLKNGELLTPPLTEGCVAGTMRSAILELANQLKIKAVEMPVTKKTLAESEEVFLTNAIQGIRWVRKVEGVRKDLGKDFSFQLLNELNRIAVGQKT